MGMPNHKCSMEILSPRGAWLSRTPTDTAGCELMTAAIITRGHKRKEEVEILKLAKRIRKEGQPERLTLKDAEGSSENPPHYKILIVRSIVAQQRAVGAPQYLFERDLPGNNVVKYFVDIMVRKPLHQVFSCVLWHPRKELVFAFICERLLGRQKVKAPTFDGVINPHIRK